MSTKEIISNILEENPFGAKDRIESVLYNKMASCLEEKRKEKYSKDTEKDDDGEGLDPVGAEDDDVDNDGDSDESDEYLKNRRNVVTKKVKEVSESLKEDDLNEALPLLGIAARFLAKKAVKGLAKVGGRMLKGAGRKIAGLYGSGAGGASDGGGAASSTPTPVRVV